MDHNPEAFLALKRYARKLLVDEISFSFFCYFFCILWCDNLKCVPTRVLLVYTHTILHQYASVGLLKLSWLLSPIVCIHLEPKSIDCGPSWSRKLKSARSLSGQASTSASSGSVCSLATSWSFPVLFCWICLLILCSVVPGKCSNIVLKLLLWTTQQSALYTKNNHPNWKLSL